MSHTKEITPYEQFLIDSIEDQTSKYNIINSKFLKSRGMRKMLLKRQLDEVSQNIEIVKKDLAKYESGLSWLREHTKERDEKSEHLGAVDVSAILGSQKPAPAAPGAAAAKPAPQGGSPVGKPAVTVGSPVSRAAPSVGTPVARPAVGSPIKQAPQSPGQASPVAPVVSTPVAKPQAAQAPPSSTPEAKPEAKKDEKKSEEQSSASQGSS